MATLAAFAKEHWLVAIVWLATFLALVFGWDTAFPLVGVWYIVLAVLTTAFVSAHRNRELRGEEIRKSIEDSARAQRAKELFISAERYRSQALLNSFAAIGILVLIALFVGLAGQFLTQDSVDLKALAEVKQRLDNVERRAFEEGANPRSLDAYSQLLSLYAEATSKQLAAEVMMNDPSYRMVSTFLIRISVVLVGLYSVLLMNRAFQYNNALAAMYRARLVSVLRGDQDTSEFITYAAVYDPVVMKYDPDIKHPIEHLTEFLTSFATFMSRKIPPSPLAHKAKAKNIPVTVPDEDRH